MSAFYALLRVLLIPRPLKVYTGTYRQQSPWLVVDAATRSCAIIHRPTTRSGPDGSWVMPSCNNTTLRPRWRALTVFGDILEYIIQTESHSELDDITHKFFGTYKAHGPERYDEASEQSLIDIFAALENYIPPNMVAVVPPQDAHIQALEEMRKEANHTLQCLREMRNQLNSS